MREISVLDHGTGLMTMHAECGPGTELEKKLNQILETQQEILRLLRRPGVESL